MDEFTIASGTPGEFLAWDEAFLDGAEAGDHGEVLWFWESPAPFVVIGYGQQLRREVAVEACESAGVPILRRCSGGGAVVQGPGCLNYGLVLRIEEGGPTGTITGTNHYVMERNRKTLAALLPDPVVIRGHTDLARVSDGAELKFSGNAQRRRRRHLLFHGTFLLHFDLPLAARFLNFPSLVPEYRRGRSHEAFIANTHLEALVVKEALRREWGVLAPAIDPREERMRTALEARYSRPEWHLRT